MAALAPWIVGNWKMNGLSSDLDEALAIAQGVAVGAHARVAICAPATLVHRLAGALHATRVEVGGEDCRAEESGAFTGDVSAEMLADAGAKLVILGHSERRAGYGESDALVCGKVEAALRAGLHPIVCVGETLEQRDAGEAVAVVTGQAMASLPAALAGERFAVAYEPVWAIGTGRTASTADIAQMHAAIRGVLVDKFGDAGAKISILYGGSVKPANAAEILATAEVGGALVGGASLKAADFLPIIEAAPPPAL
ncbi:MAG: triose-phosphate isomerase [Caulobacteraceae bacterium]|nr:triose-phosphate isomerase [Caulobacteraceae bacterium]